MLRALLLLVLVPSVGIAQVDDARLSLPDLRQEDLPRWRAHVRPTADELAFEQIAWIPSFAAGIQASERQGKPLLFWAMNGHPLGCT